MATTTRERNYTKNPHTARFLQTFHSGIGSNGRDDRAEMADDAAALAAEAAEDNDLLGLVEDKVEDLRTGPQAKLMDRLISQITELDAELGAAARTWTDKATASGAYWTPGRQGTASAWITKLIDKAGALRVEAARKAPATPAAKVADGRYAVEEDGVLRFFKVKNGRRPGFVFLDIQASDEWRKISSVTRIRKIMALIAQDPHAAMIRYGHELGECGRCGKVLTDEASRAAGIGPVCASK
jgi:hypothetical protein